jgi:hypothetical protein
MVKLMLDDGSEISQEEISRLKGRVDELVAHESWSELWSMAKDGPTLITVPAMVHVWEEDDSGEIMSCGPQFLKFLATRFTNKNVGSQRELQVELLRGWRSKQHRAYMDVANSLLNRPTKIE